MVMGVGMPGELRLIQHIPPPRWVVKTATGRMLTAMHHWTPGAAAHVELPVHQRGQLEVVTPHRQSLLQSQGSAPQDGLVEQRAWVSTSAVLECCVVDLAVSPWQQLLGT